MQTGNFRATHLYSELVESAYRIEIVLGATQSGHYTGFYTARLKELVFKKTQFAEVQY
jgi:hypothetical protein